MQTKLPEVYVNEIVEFFKTKHMDVEVIDIPFESHMYKSQQCSVQIRLKEKTMERRALGIEPINVFITLSSFKLITLPGCCGIIVSTGAWVLYRIHGYGIGQFLHTLRIKIAKEWGYGCMLCTDVSTNKIQNHILEKNNWKILETFDNPRTNNNINIHYIKL